MREAAREVTVLIRDSNFADASADRRASRRGSSAATGLFLSGAARPAAAGLAAGCAGFAAPEGAATLAGLQHLIDTGWVQPDERIVLFNTGSGLKYLDTIVS